MGRRVFKPLEDTVQEKPGQKYVVEWRMGMSPNPDPEARWTPAPLPLPMNPGVWRTAEQLTSKEAKEVLDYWAKKGDCMGVEFRITKTV